jgi:ribosomal protein S17E
MQSVVKFIKRRLILQSMGRIKAQPIKRLSLKLFAKHSAETSEDFAKNKELVRKLATIPSKKILNSVAGYVTRLNRMAKKKSM